LIQLLARFTGAIDVSFAVRNRNSCSRQELVPARGKEPHGRGLQARSRRTRVGWPPSRCRRPGL
jgi:hypothetical protein